MPSFGFKLPFFIFAAVSTLAQTAQGQPATPKPIPANTAPDVATIEHGDPGSKQWKFSPSKLAEQLAFGRCNLLIALRSVLPNKIRLHLFDRLLSNADS